jgi:hypothetical protein
MNLPNFPEFKLIGLEDQEYIRNLIEKYPSEGCEINFANTFIWRNFDHPKATTINDNLCLLFKPPAEPAYFLQPIGENRIIETIKTCLSSAPRLSRIPESFAEKYCCEFRCEPDRNNFDYVYLAEDLIQLKGKKYDGRRNRIRKFEKNHSYRYLKLSAQHLADCRRLLEGWFKEKQSNAGMISAQKDAIIEALTYFETLDLVGCAIEVEGQIEAFSIGEKFNQDTAVIHIEIVNPVYDGLSQLINREFIKNAWADYKFINREQDLGIPGLRRAKSSYYPHHLVKKYNITARQI